MRFTRARPTRRRPRRSQQRRLQDLTPRRSSASTRRAEPDSLQPGDILHDITQRNSTFTKADLHYEIRNRLTKVEGPDFDPHLVGKIAKSVGEHNDFIPLGRDEVDRHRYTSRDMLGTELAMRDASDELKARKGTALRPKSPSPHPLQGSRRAAAKSPRSRYRRFEPCPGHWIRWHGQVQDAGGWQRNLGRARQAGPRGAVAGIAAESLQNGSGIKSSTLYSFLASLERLPDQEEKLAAMDAKLEAFHARGDKGRRIKSEMKAGRDQFAAKVNTLRLSERDVIVLDEAGMVGSKQMNHLLQAAKKAGAKVVMVGDAEQLQAIDAGAGFRALTERHGSVKIDEVRRQKTDWQKRRPRLR